MYYWRAMPQFFRCLPVPESNWCFQKFWFPHEGKPYSIINWSSVQFIIYLNWSRGKVFIESAKVRKYKFNANSNPYHHQVQFHIQYWVSKYTTNVLPKQLLELLSRKFLHIAKCLEPKDHWSTWLYGEYWSIIK